MRRLILCVAMLVVLAAPGQLPAASFQGLGFLPGGNSSQAFGVSGDGLVIVGDATTQGFRWTAQTEMVELVGGGISDVSYDGSVIVGGGGRWTADTGWVDLGYLFVPDDEVYPEAVSPDGSVVVGKCEDQAFRWTAQTGMVDLGPASTPGETGAARGVSADGSVIVGDPGLWTADTGWTDIGGWCADVTPDGSVAVGLHGRWTAQTGWVSLGLLPGHNWTYPSAVSADGQVVVGFSMSDTGQEAFLWTADMGIRNLEDVLTNDFGLDLGYWDFEEATDVSADGTVIVGFGNSNGTQAFRAVIPEPSSFAMLGAGVVALLLVIRRKRCSS